MFKIESEFGNHHPGFTEGAGKEGAHQQALGAGKAMAMTVLDLIADPQLVADAKESFAATKQ
jgi:hypothetical protein